MTVLDNAGGSGWHTKAYRVRRLIAVLTGACAFGLGLTPPITEAASSCGGKRATLVVRSAAANGTARADVIVVRKPDGARVDGRGGNDLICGSRGRDWLVGGRGDDRLHGGGGRDRVDGGIGDDRLDGGKARDRLLGRAGHDSFRTTRGDKTDVAAGERLNGRAKRLIAKPRKGTVQTPLRFVERVTQGANGRARVNVGPGAKVPKIGGILVVAAGRAGGEGVLGRVTKLKRSRNGSTITTRPATLDEAYKRFSASRTGNLEDLLNQSAGARSAVSIPKFTCTSSSGPPIKTDVDLSKVKFWAEIDTHGPSIHVLLTGTPKLTTSFAFSGRVTCKANASGFIPVAGPLGVNITLKPSFTAGGTIAADYTFAPRIAYGFYRSRTSGNADFHTFKPTGGIRLRGEASLEVSYGIGLEASLAGRVGVGGTLKLPVITAGLKASSAGIRCFTADAEVNAALTASADVFFTKWNFTLASATFGRTELYRSCRGHGPGGGGLPGGGAVSGGGPNPNAPYPGPPPEPTTSEARDLSVGNQYACAIRGGVVSCFGRKEWGYGAAPGGAFQQISSDFFSCGVRTTGDLACWGSASAPPGIPAGRFTSVSTGAYHACALRANFTVACWGDIEDPPTAYFTQISSGNGYSCGIRTDGTAACWGTALPPSGWAITPPPGRFTQISAGEREACGLRPDGDIECWRDGAPRNHDGTYRAVTVGRGAACALRADGGAECFAPVSSYSPSVLVQPPAGPFRAISLNTHGCGERFDGRIVCWGGLYRGQTPPPTGSFDQLAAADYFTCAIRGDGTATCWGDSEAFPPPPELSGAYSQIAGFGALGGRNICSIRESDATLECSGLEPAAGTFTDVAIGWGRACAIATGGTLTCFGWSAGPAPPTGTFVQVVGGGDPEAHFCGRRSNNTVACWGPHADKWSVPSETFRDLDANDITACGVRTDQTLQCWTRATYAGPGSPPVGTFTSVAVGERFACAVRTNGALACWGENDLDQARPPAGTFASVVAGASHACARRPDGTVACWGDSTY